MAHLPSRWSNGHDSSSLHTALTPPSLCLLPVPVHTVHSSTHTPSMAFRGGGFPAQRQPSNSSTPSLAPLPLQSPSLGRAGQNQGSFPFGAAGVAMSPPPGASPSSSRDLRTGSYELTSRASPLPASLSLQATLKDPHQVVPRQISTSATSPRSDQASVPRSRLPVSSPRTPRKPGQVSCPPLLPLATCRTGPC
jgi:hypothetical protein